MVQLTGKRTRFVQVIMCPTGLSVCLVELVGMKHFVSKMSLASTCTCQDLTAFSNCPLRLGLYGIKYFWLSDFSLTLMHPRHGAASTGDVTHTGVMWILKVKANLREENPTGLVDNGMAISTPVLNPCALREYSIGEWHLQPVLTPSLPGTGQD